VQKAKAAGLEQDPVYQKRVKEYNKTLLINLHRERLAKGMEPSDKDLKAYYEANRSRFMLPEARKVQMVVVKTQAEAESLKSEIEAGKITMYQAARDHSIAAKAKQNLGEVGWVNQGDTVPALDKAIFALGPGKIGGPVESPAGWHLVTVLDVKDARFTDFTDEGTRKLTRRRYLHDKLDAYTADLRKNQFPVEVYQERLVQLEQQEADMVKSLAEKAKQPGSVTQQRIKELQKLMKP
jgi:parvulin-like peptidyl-prolyl isomerase